MSKASSPKFGIDLKGYVYLDRDFICDTFDEMKVKLAPHFDVEGKDRDVVWMETVNRCIKIVADQGYMQPVKVVNQNMEIL